MATKVLGPEDLVIVDCDVHDVNVYVDVVVDVVGVDCVYGC